MKTRVAIIGAGFGARVLLPAFRRNRRCEVVCVSSRTSKNNLAWTSIVRDPAIDAVAIAVPPRTQVEIASAAIRNRKAVFCEKPLAASFDGASKLARLASRHRVPNVVDFEFPEIPEWKRAKAIVAAGGIGRLRHAVLNWNVETFANKRRLVSWKTRREEGGGALCAFASHSFYYLEWLFGRIRGLSCRLSHAEDLPGKGDTAVSLGMEWAGGAVASACISTHAIRGNGHRLEIYGSRGSLVLDNPTSDYVNGFSLWQAGLSLPMKKIVQSAQKKEDGRIAAVALLADKFIRWVQTGKPAGPDFQTGLRVQHLLDAAVRSHEKGCWIKI